MVRLSPTEEELVAQAAELAGERPGVFARRVLVAAAQRVATQ